MQEADQKADELTSELFDTEGHADDLAQGVKASSHPGNPGQRAAVGTEAGLFKTAVTYAMTALDSVAENLAFRHIVGMMSSDISASVYFRIGSTPWHLVHRPMYKARPCWI
jgi:hypothetical protein